MTEGDSVFSDNNRQFTERECESLANNCTRAAIPDNVHSPSGPRPSGNSREAALRRLAKDRPDLLAEVEAGRLSAHGAMVKAGFRPRAVSVPVGAVARAAGVLARNFQGDATRLIEAIREIATEFPAARET